MKNIYSFLKDIGNRNRLWLRHINLLFIDKDSLFYPDEEWFLNPNRGSYSSAHILGNALQLLAKGHALRSLRLHTACAIDKDDNGKLGTDCIWPAFMASMKIKQYFLDLKGINEVSIRVAYSSDEDKESIKALEREMENRVP